MLGRKKVSKTEVLSKYSDYDIYSFYLEDFEVGKPMLSPLRDESNPSFSIFQGDSELIWKDYGQSGPDSSGDCFRLVMGIYGLNSYSEAVQKVWSDLNRGHIEGTPQEQMELIRPEKKESVIVVQDEPLTKLEHSFLDSFGILNKTDILRPKAVWYNNQPFYLQRKKYGLILAYQYWKDSLPYYKLYRPYATGKSKWPINNVRNDMYDGILKPREKLIITKSRKDFRTLESFIPDIFGFQSENLACFSNSIMAKIKESAKDIYLWLDNDPVGKANSDIITKQWDLKQIFTPDECLPLNDPAGVRQKYGPKAITKILKINGFYD